MQIGLVWLLIQAIWSGEVSSVSIIVIGLVQVWSGFQTFSTLSRDPPKAPSTSPQRVSGGDLDNFPEWRLGLAE